jgi:hypothetical protein
MTLLLEPPPPYCEEYRDTAIGAMATHVPSVLYYTRPLVRDAFGEAERAIDQLTPRGNHDLKEFRLCQEDARAVVRGLARAGIVPARVSATADGGVAVHLPTGDPRLVVMFDCGIYGIAALWSSRGTGEIETWDVAANPMVIDQIIAHLSGKLTA